MSGSWRSVQAQAPERVRVIIAYTAAPDDADEAAVRSVGGSVRYRYRIVNAIAASIPPQAVQALRANTRVAAVEPDVQVQKLDAELDNSWGVKRIGAGTVHGNGNRGAGIKVAILDSGIDYTHPDLSANYGGGYDFVNGDPDPFDDNEHGTHVAGTVAAVDDDSGVVGVAPLVTLLAVKVLDENGNGFYSDVMAGLQWAAENGALVTNNSYGSSGDPGQSVKAAFDNTALAGILHVAAAGNTGNCGGAGDNVGYPARYSSVVAVAATDSSDARACFSSTGPGLTLAAPGVGINSTVPGNGYALFNGTSMASPHGAGTAALVLAAGVTDGNGNGRRNDEVAQILVATAQDLGAAGFDTFYGYGLVNAAAAVAAVGVAPQPPAGLYADVVDNQVTLHWTPPASGPSPTGYLLAAGLSPGEVLASAPTGSTVPQFAFTAPNGSFYLRVHSLVGGLTSGASNEILVTVPAGCIGPPMVPTNFQASNEGSVISISWDPPASGPAPAGYVLVVSGSFSGSVATTSRVLSGSVPSGTYILSVYATNACGSGPATGTQQVVIP